MSNISRASIYYPNSVTCDLKKTHNKQALLWISGVYGTWFYELPSKYKVTLKNNSIYIQANTFYSVAKYYHAKLYRQGQPNLNLQLSLISILLKRMIVGAGVGFKRYLRVRGVGYKFNLNNDLLTINVGYTHTVQKFIHLEFVVKFSRKFKVMRIRSKSLTKVTSLLRSLRSLRKPDVYKGKGLRYKHDPIIRKAGKKKTF